MLSTDPRPLDEVKQHTPILQAAKTILSLLLWLCLSSAVVLSNKWLLNPNRFPFPVTLGFLHMLFCSCVGLFAVHLQWVPAQNVPWTVLMQTCLPVAVLGATGLIFANASFLFLSIAYAQMLKANMPVLIYIVGCMFRTHKFDWPTTGIMFIIGFGVATSSAGEMHSSGLGMVFILLSMLAEAFRMTILQTVMQQADLHIDPINALYYITPASAMCLMPVVLITEGQQIYSQFRGLLSLSHFLVCSSAAACLLNIVIFWVASSTSVLTMKLASIVKDALLIFMSSWIFETHLTPLNLGGYMVALAGIVLHKTFPPHVDKNMQKPCLSNTDIRQKEVKCLLHVDNVEA